MLVITFKAGTTKYSLPCKLVMEITPMVELTPLDKAPEFIAGLFNYRGRITPVVDLCVMSGFPPCAGRMSTRIIIVEYSCYMHKYPLGILAEKVTDTITINEDELQSTGLELPDAPYLGHVAAREDGLVHLMDIDELLTEPVKKLLFNDNDDNL